MEIYPNYSSAWCTRTCCCHVTVGDAVATYRYNLGLLRRNAFDFPAAYPLMMKCAHWPPPAGVLLACNPWRAYRASTFPGSNARMLLLLGDVAWSLYYNTRGSVSVAPME